MEKSSIIAAVRDDKKLEAALMSNTKTIFLLSSDIMTLSDTTEKIHKAGKEVFVHMDFADGVGKDVMGVKFIKSVGADGIISTRAGIVKIAREEGLKTVLRVFTLDSHSLETAFDSIKTTKPEMIEIMPGVITKTVKLFSEKLSIPVIAGGLINTIEEVENAMDNGAFAVSTGEESLF